MQDDGFQLVLRKRKSRFNEPPVHFQSSSCLHCLGRTCNDIYDISTDSNNDLVNDFNYINQDKVIASIQSCREELQSSDLYKSVNNTLVQSLKRLGVNDDESSESSESPSFIHFATLICYGLGNFSSCKIARYQLALFLCLMEDLKSEGLLFDPAFSKEEITILTRLNCSVIGNNEEGKRSVELPTLFYMPHCAKELYNNLLWANWTGPSLSKLVILGNSFSHMMDNLPFRQFQKNWNYILKVVPLIEEFGIENRFRYNDIFNDTAVHIFSKSKISRMQLNFWLDHDEPMYQDDL